MANTNARGVQNNITATASGDIVKSMAFTAAGVAVDLTGQTIDVIVKDDDGSADKTYPQTITNAAGGLFTLKIPKAAMTGKEGEELSYELLKTDASGNIVPYMYGEIQVFETV